MYMKTIRTARTFGFARPLAPHLVHVPCHWYHRYETSPPLFVGARISGDCICSTQDSCARRWSSRSCRPCRSHRSCSFLLERWPSLQCVGDVGPMLRWTCVLSPIQWLLYQSLGKSYLAVFWFALTLYQALVDDALSTSLEKGIGCCRAFDFSPRGAVDEDDPFLDRSGSLN
jgi:hypothetical protein